MWKEFNVLTLILIWLTISVDVVRSEEKKPLAVFILAGQSNMAGSGQSDELPVEYQTSPSNVRVLGRRGQLEPLMPQGRFGPDVSFSHALAKAWPDRTIVIVKHAVGGTSALAWSPNWSEEQARITGNERNGPLYDRLMARVKPLMEREDVEIVAMLWAQGGRDARFEQAAKEYKENLKKIIEAVRRDVGNPRLPFLLAQTVDAPPRAFPYIETVRKAQQEISKEVPGTRLISSDKLAKHRDNIHFNTEGQIELGKRFARALLVLARMILTFFNSTASSSPTTVDIWSVFTSGMLLSGM